MFDIFAESAQIQKNLNAITGQGTFSLSVYVNDDHWTLSIGWFAGTELIATANYNAMDHNASVIEELASDGVSYKIFEPNGVTMEFYQEQADKAGVTLFEWVSNKDQI